VQREKQKQKPATTPSHRAVDQGRKDSLPCWCRRNVKA
jgi:hypothetical protein